jgi:hypothetical protein
MEPSLTPESDLWSALLPVSRHAFHQADADRFVDTAITYGDYFTAVQHYLSQDDMAPVRRAGLALTGRRLFLTDIDGIAIYLVKHGAFYHPAYGVLTVKGRPLPFVVNVAVSRAGREVIDGEYAGLARLNGELDAPFWPAVFGIGRGNDLHGRQIPMFLGQWFDGFCEFHLTGEAPDQYTVAVWDRPNGRHLLGPDQVVRCLGQAAVILAYAYNPLTFESIRNWHHAAGDFVIAMDGENIDLRLITVRRYAPMIDDPAPDVSSMLEALLLLLVEVSLKLRLDRLDGVGRMVCHHRDVIPAICQGFFKGVQMGAAMRGLPEDLATTVKEYAALHNADQLMAIAVGLMAKAAFDPEERRLVRTILGRHISGLGAALTP